MDDMMTSYQKLSRSYKKNEVIFNDGDPGNEMFIISNGRVRIQKQTSDGQEKILSIMNRGDYFGEMALIDFTPRSATAIAEEDSELLVLDGPKFAYFIQQLPEFSIKIMQKLSQRIKERDPE